MGAKNNRADNQLGVHHPALSESAAVTPRSIPSPRAAPVSSSTRVCLPPLPLSLPVPSRMLKRGPLPCTRPLRRAACGPESNGRPGPPPAGDGPQRRGGRAQGQGAEEVGKGRGGAGETRRRLGTGRGTHGRGAARLAQSPVTRNIRTSRAARDREPVHEPEESAGNSTSESGLKVEVRVRVGPQSQVQVKSIVHSAYSAEPEASFGNLNWTSDLAWSGESESATLSALSAGSSDRVQAPIIWNLALL